MQLIKFFFLNNLAEVPWAEEFCSPCNCSLNLPALRGYSGVSTEGREDDEDLQTLNVQSTAVSFIENKIHNFAALGSSPFSIYLLKFTLNPSTHTQAGTSERTHLEVFEGWL